MVNIKAFLTTLYVTMYKDSAVTAVFTKRQATLTITVNPANGGNTAPLPQVWTYDYGTSIPVKEYASSGYVFDGWYLDGIYKGTGQTLDVTMNKDHQLAAYFATPETVTPKPNDTRIRTALAVSGKSSASYTNFNVVIDGWLTANGTSLVDYPILISYSITGGKSWKDLTLVRTNDKGVFSATWMPEVTGDYEIKATWEGDTTYTDATTIVNFAVNPVNENSIFSVTSNSTLTQLAFDSNTSKFSFSVSGPDGSTGYVNLYVPKSLMADTSKLTVLLDGTPISYTTQSGGDSWLVLFSYTHSTHAVTVNLSGTPAETAGSNLQNLLIYAIPVIAIVLAVVAVVALRRRKKA